MKTISQNELERRRKISISLIGNKRATGSKPWLGKKRPNISGTKHHAWKGGLASGENRKKYVSEYNKNWNKKNKLRKNHLTMQRLLVIKGVSGNHSFEEWEALVNRFDRMCLCCKRKEPEISLSKDHIVPLSLGGTNEISNIQPLCRSCNSRKHARYIDYISLYQLKNES